MGYAPEMYQLVTHTAFPPEGNDQLYYTKLYVNQELRQNLGIKLDHLSEIFQSLFLAMDDIEIRYNGRDSYVYNKVYDTVPMVVHTNGPVKPFIGTLANYIPKTWNPIDGCVHCLDDTKYLKSIEVSCLNLSLNNCMN